MRTRASQQRPMILVVDDEASIFEVISQILASDGLHTVWAKSADQAVAVARKTLPDVIVLDLKLGDHNGLEILGELKVVCKDSPVIILTGFGSRETAREAMESGVFEYLTKPFDVQELRSAVRNALEMASVLPGKTEGNCAR